MRSIELTLDGATDAAFRAQWAALADAGLPSLASHTGASNRPHVTLAAGDRLADGAVLRSAIRLPVELVFGGLLLFDLPRGRVVLARAVVVTRGLLDLHELVHSAVDGSGEQTRPGAWSPHVTLSRRLTPEQVALALPVLEDVEPGQAVAARLWDGVAKITTDLS